MNFSLPEFRVDPPGPRIVVLADLTELLKQGFTICMKISDGKVIEANIRTIVPTYAPLRETKVTEEAITIVELEEKELDLMKKGFVLEVCIMPTGRYQVLAQKDLI